jgi:hypothetical protein
MVSGMAAGFHVEGQSGMPESKGGTKALKDVLNTIKDVTSDYPLGLAFLKDSSLVKALYSLHILKH